MRFKLNPFKFEWAEWTRGEPMGGRKGNNVTHKRTDTPCLDFFHLALVKCKWVEWTLVRVQKEDNEGWMDTSTTPCL